MFGDTGALSFQLELYRWEDHFQRMRDLREARIEQSNSAILRAHYNDLVDRFNRLLNVSEETAQAADRLQDHVRQKDREIADLREQLASAKAEIQHVREVWAGSSAEYARRMYAAEDALKELRSQQE